MRGADSRQALTPLDRLEQCLQERAASGVPVIVVRLPAFERIAWRKGRRSARALERRAGTAFAAAAARVLRVGDLIAHDAASDVFVAALTAPMRHNETGPAPIDPRSALARISATMESATLLDVDTGWTTYAAGSDARSMDRVIERALARGAQERERYAFFSALGHELRTPLSSIRGYLETLLDDGIDARTRMRFLTIAYNESLRLSRLVEGMFEISLLDLHAAFPARSSGSLELALKAACDACNAVAVARQVTIRCDRVPPTDVAIDEDRLTLVLINLLDNAVKHGRLGGTVRIGTNVSDRRHATVTIDDDGPGILPPDRERVFYLGARGVTSASGTGIGLALVRLMLERVGGRVEAGDSPLGGARFTIAIPRRVEQ